MTNKELVEANREWLFKWVDEGKSYFWIARQIGLGERNASAVFWFNYTSDREDKEIMVMNCVMCGSRYYGRNYYQRHYGRPKAGNIKKYTEKE